MVSEWEKPIHNKFRKSKILIKYSKNFHSCGVGGGSFMMINDENNDVREFINCREKAPAAAFEGTQEP